MASISGRESDVSNGIVKAIHIPLRPALASTKLTALSPTQFGDLITETACDRSRPAVDRAQRVIEMMCAAKQARPNLLSPASLARMIYELGKLAKSCGSVKHEMTKNGGFKELLTEVAKAVPRCQARNLANTAWGLAYLEVKDNALTVSLAESAIRRIQQFTPQNLSNTAWAFASLNIQNTALFRAVADAAIVKMPAFKPQNLANIAWAFATLGIRDSAFFDVLADAAIYRMNDFNPQDIANTSWAFATLSVPNKALFAALAEATRARMNKFSSQDFANTAWAFAVFESCEDLKLSRKLVDAFSEKAGKAEEHFQIHQASVACGLRESGDYSEPLKSCISKNISHVKLNRFEAAVADVLLRLKKSGFLDHCEPRVVIDGIETDFTVTMGDSRWVVECDGSKYHRLSDGTVPGNDLIQDRIFKRAGYRVLHILDTEWAATPNKTAWISERLRVSLREPSHPLGSEIISFSCCGFAALTKA